MRVVLFEEVRPGRLFSVQYRLGECWLLWKSSDQKADVSQGRPEIDELVIEPTQLVQVDFLDDFSLTPLYRCVENAEVMDVRKFCVYYATRDSLLSIEEISRRLRLPVDQVKKILAEESCVRSLRERQ